MKLPLLTAALALGLTSLAANATIVTVNQNIVDFLTNPANSGHTKDVLFDDGLGDKVTLRFTISNLPNVNFTNLDGGTNVGVASGDSNHMGVGKDVTFSAAYLSSSGSVDPNSIGFQFNSIGFRTLTTGTDLMWQLNGGSKVTIASIANTQVQASYAVDSTFTTIGSTAGNYSGVFSTDQTVGQFSNQVGITQGLQFSVQFVPEPSAVSASMGGAGLLLGFRRRRC